MGAEASAAEGDLAKDDGCPDALVRPRAEPQAMRTPATESG